MGPGISAVAMLAAIAVGRFAVPQPVPLQPLTPSPPALLRVKCVSAPGRELPLQGSGGELPLLALE